ncbi:DUF3108 domain-containing protein [Vandammella animalimorsus]|uniref:DUF3108 domain-containing protein n=1 Tax=Vandammella animalimorsus TaxID=2029117 RepID=A0A3M6RJP1_9BURK|nr:DUF3108 domain-containing protein [Vandammella animalimorsus]RMX15657.1 DUF3108 domain-containing protein [Vandammella animalimorsus]
MSFRTPSPPPRNASVQGLGSQGKHERRRNASHGPWPTLAWGCLALLLIAPPAAAPAQVADAAPAAAQQRAAMPPAAHLQFDAKGKISGFSYSASAQLHWQHDGHSYRAEQSIKAPLMGTRSQVSSGRIQAGHLQPLQFTDSARKKRNLRFDPAAGKVTVVASGQTDSVPPDAQDRLSVFFQLAARVAGDAGLRAKGQRIPIWTVASNKQESWVFEVEGPQSLPLPAGTLPTIKLRRLPRKADDQQAEIWLAASTGYLPVRILLQDDGDAVDLQMKRYIPVKGQP